MPAATLRKRKVSPVIVSSAEELRSVLQKPEMLVDNSVHGHFSPDEEAFRKVAREKGIDVIYEPVLFVLRTGIDGEPARAIRPDFYLVNLSRDGKAVFVETKTEIESHYRSRLRLFDKEFGLDVDFTLIQSNGWSSEMIGRTPKHEARKKRVSEFVRASHIVVNKSGKPYPESERRWREQVGRFLDQFINEESTVLFEARRRAG